MEREIGIPLAAVVERRKVDHPWADWSWRPVAVIPGESSLKDWSELESGDGWTRFHAGTEKLMLYRTDTEAYRVALSQEEPKVYVVLRPDEEGDADRPYRLAAITASPYEAQDFLDSGEELVEPVAMPVALVAIVQRFIDAHHVDEPFKKRKRDRIDPEASKFGKEPIFAKGRSGGAGQQENEP